ncbi:MAG: hypothetical protein JW395_0154 [Nitrospira sp.]|nr:hypothetical protein [Nitrospira sp.]
MYASPQFRQTRSGKYGTAFSLMKERFGRKSAQFSLVVPSSRTTPPSIPLAAK